MNKEYIITKNQIKDYLRFFLIIFCFVCIPAIILTYSFYRYYQINEEKIISGLKTYNQHLISELRRNVSAEKYFCRIFNEYNLKELDKPDSNFKDSVDFCTKLKKEYGNRIDFVVLTNDGEIRYNTNPRIYNYSKNIWYDAYHFAKHYFSPSEELLNKGARGNGQALKTIFGVHFIPRTIRALYLENIYSLIWGDYSGEHLPGGVYTFKWGGFFVFISKDLLNDIAHLKNNIIEYSSDNNIIAGLFDIRKVSDSIWTNKNIKNYEELIINLKKSESQSINFIETNNYYICNQSLTDYYRLFTFTKKDNTKPELLIKCILLFFIYCIFSGHIIKYFINTILLKKPGEASIGLKIAFLFFFATAIPLILLAVVSYEYEIHKRETLIKEAKMWSTENILNIEQRYQSYLKTLSIRFDSYIDEWKKGLKDKNLTYDYMHILGKKFAEYNVLDYYCVSTNTPYIAAVEGFFKYEGSLDYLQFDLSNSVFNYDQDKVKPNELVDFVNRYKLSDYRLMILIVKKLWNDLYGAEIPASVLSKLEIVAESMMQKKLSEIVYNCIEIEKEGIIKEWGYGNRIFGAYIKIISLYDKSFADYCIILSWLPQVIQKMFVMDIATKSNRNNKYFKLFAYERFERIFIPENTNKELIEFAKRAGVKPTEELEIINYNGEDYIAVSVLGKNLNRYSFVGLYPMKNIDNEINKQKSLLWLFGVFTLILSVGLAQLLSKSFINPLLVLQEGALAIENRNFKYRLPGMSSDEFGEVGSIFNNVMVGLEELEIAKIVQESMFPKPEFSQGKFSIYGKSITMIDVGGDYLDFFKVDDNSFAVLLGDVAGHGVGAAVLMAMAKAGILNSKEVLHSPAAVLNQIHKIILAAKNSKQRKIMTFQYLYVNSETGENLYGNAGACSPWLVRHSENSIQEIKMAGPVLGAFKKAVYKEMSLDLKPGDAVIFYTDGIVESKDRNGEMLGYDRLQEIMLKSWDVNPEIYYNNIYKSYIDFVGEGTEASDDLTFVILTYNG